MNKFTIRPMLGAQVGIQYAGLVDQTEVQVTRVGMPIVIGYFSRGTPFNVVEVTKTTLDAVLGYTPNNLHYMQVKLLLDRGISPVQVLNLGSLNDDATFNTPCKIGTEVLSVKFDESIQKSKLRFYVEHIETVSDQEQKTYSQHEFELKNWHKALFGTEINEEFNQFVRDNKLLSYTTEDGKLELQLEHKTPNAKNVASMRIEVVQDQPITLNTATTDGSMSLSDDQKTLQICLIAEYAK